jgi:hypothetical protein
MKHRWVDFYKQNREARKSFEEHLAEIQQDALHSIVANLSDSNKAHEARGRFRLTQELLVALERKEDQ